MGHEMHVHQRRSGGAIAHQLPSPRPRPPAVGEAFASKVGVALTFALYVPFRGHLLRRPTHRLAGNICRRIASSLFARAPFRRLICWHAPRSVPKVAITFDDGPNAHTTPRVLEILDAAGIRCTFFLLGREIARHPAIARAIADAGHEIGIHGFDHSSDDMPGQIARCEAELSRLGLSSRLFRPARGRCGAAVLVGLWRRGFTTVLWSFDARDSMRYEGKWRGPPPAYETLKRGEIILMHDDNSACTAELPTLLASLKTKGLTPVTISELL